MFRNLVESASHTKDFKRRGSFFAGTLGLCMLLLTAAGVGSIYAYNINLDTEDDFELLAVMRFPARAESVEPEKTEAPKAAESRSSQPATRSTISVITPYNNEREVAAANIRETPARLSPHVRLGIDNGVEIGASVGPPTPGTSDGSSNG